MCDISEFKT